MTWRKLDSDEQWQFRMSDVRPAGKAWGRSISRVLVEVVTESQENYLLDGGEDSMLTAGMIRAWPDLHPCAVADWAVALSDTTLLVRTMEASPEATAYVLEIPEYQDTRGGDKTAHIRRAKDLARSTLAKHYANEAIKEIGMGLDRNP